MTATLEEVELGVATVQHSPFKLLLQEVSRDFLSRLFAAVLQVLNAHDLLLLALNGGVHQFFLGEVPSLLFVANVLFEGLLRNDILQQVV